MRYTRIIPAMILAMVSTAAFAQNYDPTVEVTNDFVSNMADAKKVDVKSSVPDSLTRFNLDFDYEVFSKPYQGSYTFTPYNVMFIADDEVAKRPYFYMNAGAGYGLHPVFTAVVSPRLGKKVTMDIYQDFGGYYGKYEKYDQGCDLSELAGVRGSLRLDALDFLFDVNYNGFAVQDPVLTSGMYHSVNGSARITSSDIAENFMTYDVTAAYSLGRELAGPAPLTESSFMLAGSLAPTIQYERLGFVLDFNTGYKGYYGTMDTALYSIETTPKFQFNLWKFNFSLGAKLSYLNRLSWNALHAYPDIRMDLRLFNDRLDIFAGVTGGDNLNSYSSLKRENHHFNYTYASRQEDILSCSRERYNAFVGVGGSISSVFQYDVRAGYARNEGAALLGMDAARANANLVLGDYSLGYIDATTKVCTRPVDFNLGVHYKSTDIDQTKAFTLPMLTSDAAVIYNWHRRMFIGANFEMATARTIEGYTIDPFYKLGLSFEMKMGRAISLWVRGDNLLNQRIERVPGIVETGIGNGICFTAGFRLDLR